jgi:acetyl esterase/lipase
MMMQTPNRRSSCSFLWIGLVILAITCSAVGQEQPVFLWPDSELVLQGKPEHEAIRIYENGEHIVSGVHRPSVTPYIPSKDRATGAGVVIVPGGGHRELWMDHEGYRVAEWLKEHGVAAFVLKYRLAHEEGSTYTIEGTELADLKRAIRLVRSRAAEWSVDRGRIGVLGFSAGGELAAMASSRYDGGMPVAKDPTERESSKPDFQALLYPVIPSGMNLSKETPPAFLVCGEDDRPDISQGIGKLYVALKEAGVSTELHIFARTGHGFGMRASNPPAVSGWVELFLQWLGTQNLLSRK